MNKLTKNKLLAYALVSFVSFTYLVLPENAGISVLLFAIIQFACLYFIVPDKKSLWFFMPIFILALNAFISGNNMWRGANFLAGMVLYAAMFCKADIHDNSARYLIDLFVQMMRPLKHFLVPIKWCNEAGTEYVKVTIRILTGVVGALIALMFLIIIMSAADSVFLHGVESMLDGLFVMINTNIAIKSCFGFIAGLYLFGAVYNAYCPGKTKINGIIKIKGDLIVINIILGAVLVVYTIFVIIQFKYLFAGAALPYGLEYYEYARRGFFELLLLTAINVFIILTTVQLTKDIPTIWSRVTKWFNTYLCTVTMILLTSSFYRMWLYSSDDGLTRLRFLVFVFLVFEGLGLLVTLYYIIKPKFNIVVVYLTITLCYYLLLNILPVDYFVAKNQVDRYFNNHKGGIDYTCTLSSDAAPQIKRLLGTEAGWQAEYYFENLKQQQDNYVPRWQRYNLSIDKAVNSSSDI